MAIVYRHRRLDTNEIFYIGIGKTEKRAYSKNYRNNWWNKIIQKSTYNIEIIAKDLTWEDACDLEKLLISEYGRRDLGLGKLVNMTDGGDGAINVIYSEERRKNISERVSGKGNPMFGRISVMKNNTHSKEAREKISKAKSGKNHHMFNKNHSDKSKQQISNTLIEKNIRCKKVINIETGEIFRSIGFVANLIGMPRTTLNDRLIGRVANDTPYKYYLEYNKE